MDMTMVNSLSGHRSVIDANIECSNTAIFIHDCFTGSFHQLITGIYFSLSQHKIVVFMSFGDDQCVKRYYWMVIPYYICEFVCINNSVFRDLAKITIFFLFYQKTP